MIQINSIDPTPESALRGEFLYRLRRELNATQNGAALALGIKVSDIVNVESGRAVFEDAVNAEIVLRKAFDKKGHGR